LALRPSKCQIGFSEIDFLGNEVIQDMKSPSKQNLEKIFDAARPQTKTQIKSFLGLTGFYQNFVPKYSEITAPLTDLLRKNQPNKVIWGQKQEEAFVKLKSFLLGNPILKLPLWDREFVLRVDASNYAIAGVLLQEHDGILHPVSFASKKLSDRESLYPISEKECLSVVWSVQRFRKFLYGTHFIIETDHKPLTILKRSDSVNPRLQRWSLSLQPFDFFVRVIPGKENVGADFFSRHFNDCTNHSANHIRSNEQVRFS
jgi:phospholipid-translocating ATPase